MPVLAEGLCVVILEGAIYRQFNEDFEAFQRLVPNASLCADTDLARVGFEDQAEAEAEAFIQVLEGHGLVHLQDGRAVDMVLIDPERGPTAPCDWLEFGQARVKTAPDARVRVCRMAGSHVTRIVMPEGWAWRGARGPEQQAGSHGL